MTERAASVDDFTLLSTDVLAEPYEYWRLLRRTAPVHPVGEGIGYTIVTRYQDVVAALRDSESFSNHLGRRFPSGDVGLRRQSRGEGGPAPRLPGPGLLGLIDVLDRWHRDGDLPGLATQ